MTTNAAYCANFTCPPDSRTTCDLIEAPMQLLPFVSGYIPEDYFKGKRVLITGATSGIGYTTAGIFAQYGAEVMGTSRTPIQKQGSVEWPLMKLDYADNKSIDDFVYIYLKQFGCPPDILISQGATMYLGASQDYDLDNIETAMRVMAMGHIRLVEKFIRRLPSKNSNFQAILGSCSFGFTNMPEFTLMNSAKNILRTYASNWGLENSATYPNVYVGFLAPTITNTPMYLNAVYYGLDCNPKTAELKEFLSQFVQITGTNPFFPAVSYLQMAYMRAQNQICDIGYFSINWADEVTAAADFEFTSFLVNMWNNKYIKDWAPLAGNLWGTFGGPTWQYNISYTQCNA